MPIVPRYDNFQVSQNAMPAPQIAAPVADNIAAKQMQQIGAAEQGLGKDMVNIAADQQQQANQVRLDDSLNQLKEFQLQQTYGQDTGFKNIKGVSALNRPDGISLAQEYGNSFQQRISEIADGLGNDAQKRAFMLNAAQMKTSFEGQITAHEAEEFKNYSLSTSEGIIQTATREAELSWNNPDAVSKSTDRIKAEVYRQAQLLGKSAEWQEAQARNLTSNAHKVALLSALQNNDASYANGYLNKFSSEMNGDDILAVRGQITKATDAVLGRNAAGQILQGNQGSINPTETERAFNIAVGTESNGRQFDKNGQPLTSSAGAIGIAQVMPTTAPEAAKLAGIDWDENKYKTDANYNRALGLAYFQKQLQDFGGNLPQAYAAYNAGPDRLKKAIAAADRVKSDPSSTNVTWMNYLPQETQNYVQKNMQAYNSGSGKPQRPSLYDLDQQLQKDPRLANNPSALKIARGELSTTYEEQTKALKQQDEANVSNAMQLIVQNGGHYSDLPVSVRAAIPADKIDTVMNFANRVNKGDNTTSLWLYNKLASDQSYLKNLSDDQFYALHAELSDTDFMHFSNERAKLNGNTPSNNPSDINSQAVNQVLNDRFRMLGMSTNPEQESKDAERLGAIKQTVNQQILVAQKSAGKKFNDAEVSSFIDNLFAKSTTISSFFGNSNGAVLGAKNGDISSKDKDAIKAAFAKRGVDSPTDGQILNAWHNMKLAQQ